MDYRKCFIYSNVRENSNKYYIIEGERYAVIYKYDRLGKAPQMGEKHFGNTYKVSEFIAKKERELLNKGYKEAPIEIIMSSTGEFLNNYQLRY